MRGSTSVCWRAGVRRSACVSWNTRLLLDVRVGKNLTAAAVVGRGKGIPFVVYSDINTAFNDDMSIAASIISPELDLLFV